MKVLIATPQPREGRALARVLGGLGHQVDVAATPGELVECLQRHHPDVALVGTVAKPWCEPFERFDSPHVYRIALLTSLEPTPVQRAWDAGFDDLMRRGACAEELAGRVAAVERIRSWVPTMGDGFSGAEAFDPLTSPSVAGLGETLADEFGAMTGGTMQLQPLEELPSIAYSAEVPLTLTSDAVEITLGVGVPSGAQDTFGTALFGEPVGGDVMADAMREFANTAGGALKRTALEHDKTYSLGLPVDCVFPSPSPESPKWSLQLDGIQLVAWVRVEDDRPRRITTSMLDEGMVLTQPVLNGAGVLLVPAGSVLTRSTVNRLLEMMGPSALVEVARAA